MQAAGCHHLVMQRLPAGFDLSDFCLPFGSRQRFIGFHRADFAIRISAEYDVGATTRHIGGDGDGIGRAGLGDDFRFARVLLGVQYFVRQFFFLEEFGKQFGVFDRGGAQ